MGRREPKTVWVRLLALGPDSDEPAGGLEVAALGDGGYELGRGTTDQQGFVEWTGEVAEWLYMAEAVPDMEQWARELASQPDLADLNKPDPRTEGRYRIGMVAWRVDGIDNTFHNRHDPWCRFTGEVGQ